MFDRAQRRHHNQRMKAKARRVARDSWGYAVHNRMTEEQAFSFQKNAERWADHLKMCNRPCCANPRRLTGELTMGEMRRDDGDAIRDVVAPVSYMGDRLQTLYMLVYNAGAGWWLMTDEEAQKLWEEYHAALYDA